MVIVVSIPVLLDGVRVGDDDSRSKAPIAGAKTQIN
jgi:hypothetical protein